MEDRPPRELERETECPPGTVWDPTLGRCVPVEEPSPPPEGGAKEAEIPPCPLPALPYPLSLMSETLCGLWNQLFLIAPDLTDTFTSAFEDLAVNVQNIMSQVGENVTEAVGDIAKAVSDTLQQLGQQIAEAGESTATAISSALDDAAAGLNEAIQAVQSGVSDLGDSLAQWASDVQKSVADALAQVNTALGDLSTGLVEGLGNVVDALPSAFEAAAKLILEGIPSTFLGPIAAAIQSLLSPEMFHSEAMQNLVRGFQMGGESTATDPATFLRDLILAPGRLLWNLLIPLLTPDRMPAEDETPETVSTLAAVWIDIYFFFAVLDIVVTAVTVGQVNVVDRVWRQVKRFVPFDDILLTYVRDTYGKVIHRQVRRYLNARYRPQIISEDRLQKWIERGLIDESEAARELTYHGFTDADIERILAEHWRPLDPNTLRELERREVIDEAELVARLKAAGYDEDSIRLLRETWPRIPGPSDLVRFMVREDLGWEWLAEWFRRIGFAEEWAKHYWDSHWELPSVSQAYELRARGQIDDNELLDLMTKQDIHPDYREKLFNIRFDTIGRIDLRRGWEAGLISDEELVKRMEWAGYSPEDAVLVAEIQKRQALEAEINALRTEARNDFLNGLIDEEQLRADLNELGFSSERIELEVAKAVRQRERNHILRTVTSYRLAYRKGLITDDEFVAGLQQLGLLDWKIDEILTEEQIRAAGKK